MPTQSTTNTASREGPFYNLTIGLSGPLRFITRIRIFNSRKQLVIEPEKDAVTMDQAAGYQDFLNQVNLLHYSLTSDQYIVRLEINGQIADTPIALQNDSAWYAGPMSPSGSQLLRTPSYYSAAPLGGEIGYESSHEYYTEPSKAISQINTFTSPGVPPSMLTGLFIFLRYPTVDIYKNIFHQQSYWDKFLLADADGKEITRFPHGCMTDTGSQTWNYEPGSGYIGFNAQLPSGTYYLIYEGKESRIIPIYVYDYKYTQLFMTVAAEPLFGSLRIFISANRTFDPSDRYLPYIDIYLDKLQNKDFTLTPELIQNIAYGKFESPMLGILGAYIYLTGKATVKDELFQKVVYNLRTIILPNSDHSPDIWALNFLSYKHNNTTIEGDRMVQVVGTPMLRIAFDTLRAAAVTLPWVIPEDSLNDHISENQAVDSPFNTFILPGGRADLSRILEGQKKPPGLEPSSRRGTIKVAPETFKLQYILDAAKRQAGDFQAPYSAFVKTEKNFSNLSGVREKTGWLGCSIVNLVNEKPDITIEEIATHLNMPLNTVSRVAKTLASL